MILDIDIGRMACNSQSCVHNNCGECTNPKARLDCLEMAFDVLGIGVTECEEAGVISDKP